MNMHDLVHKAMNHSCVGVNLQHKLRKCRDDHLTGVQDRGNVLVLSGSSFCKVGMHPSSVPDIRQRRA